eukprot:Gregarina_sp_Pseudo_9__1486@NODE_1_length_8127_cov_32_238872_g0_i0_p5_GENE_NODE_1_length_8127_cov_32_238872_g0_i0NODE_1_length_8127_cov_32_238872_g0_i0_p5_ORF_typecomplete_len225_score60_17_NODE_1_length_8127_cov_32_238872_g0_i020182692
MWFFLLLFPLLSVVEAYSVVDIDCQSAASAECAEACESAGCGRLQYVNVADAHACLPPRCDFNVTRLKRWALPVCSDAETGTYALHLLESPDLTEALRRALVSGSDAVWLSVITEEPGDGFAANTAAGIAAVAIADDDIVADEARCQQPLPEAAEQRYVITSKHLTPRLNTQVFALAPLLQLSGDAWLKSGFGAKTILIQPEMNRFVAVQNVSRRPGVGGVEVL